jgi:hypothetical protein
MKHVLTMVVFALFWANASLAEPLVVGVQPTAPDLPENILRFHITFNEPMREGVVFDHVVFQRKDTGEEVAQVFYDNFYELWSDNHRRLTLIVDPGRVKTGLAANSEMGRAFVAGDEYILSVLPGWVSLAGEPLDTQFDYAFRAFPEIRSPMAPRDWKITFENRVLSILFDRPIDIYSLSAHAVPITEDDIAVDGRWDLDGNGRSAQFTIEGDAIPTRLAIRNRFEDVAGNTIIAAFDHKSGTIDAGQERGITFVDW